MKKAIWVLGASFALVASAACSGGGGGGGGTGLTSGSYTVSGGQLTQDTCGFGQSFYSGITSATVTVSATTVTVDFGGFTEDYDLSGTTLHDSTNSGSQEFMCSQSDGNGGFACGTSNPYNCSIVSSADFSGTVTGGNKFTLTDTYSFDNGATACPAGVITSAGVTVPCTTVDTGNFAK